MQAGEIRTTRLPGRSQGNVLPTRCPNRILAGQLSRIRETRRVESTRTPHSVGCVDHFTPKSHFGKSPGQTACGSITSVPGLVDSPNDFGRLGTLPSHPELLDYLASNLMESDWDIQQIQRELV